MDFSIYTYGMIGLTTVIIAIATILDNTYNSINNITQFSETHSENIDENPEEKHEENHEEKIENNTNNTNKTNNFIGGKKTCHNKKYNNLSTHKHSRKTNKNKK